MDHKEFCINICVGYAMNGHSINDVIGVKVYTLADDWYDKYYRYKTFKGFSSHKLDNFLCYLTNNLSEEELSYLTTNFYKDRYIHILDLFLQELIF